MHSVKVFLLAIFFVLSTSAYALAPKYKDVTLKERTNFSIEIIPGLQTRLIFPFKLDDGMNDPVFKVSIPNSKVFKVEEIDKKSQLKGQNTLILKSELIEDYDVNNPHYAAVFISVNGYNITIMVKTATLQSKKYYTDVFFNLSKDDLEFLISKKVDARIQVMKKIYEEKELNLVKLAKSEAIKNVSVIALEKPDVYSIKKEFDVDLNDAQRLELYVVEALNYSDHYYVLTFEIESKGNYDVKIEDVNVALFAKKTRYSVITALNCPSVLRAGELVKCALVSEDRRLFNNDKVSLGIVTDVGSGEIEW